MPKSRTVVQIFVSSPADVRPEREALEGVVAELNRTWSNSLGITFDLLMWETHTHPAFSLDAQTAINEQIGDDYDVFLGILWGRFGTPTPRASSGTHEEFNRAVSRRKRDGVPEIMIYFKDAPIPPSRIDTDQLSRVNGFKSSLPQLGALYSIFDDLDGFESSVRSHLSVLAQKFSTKQVTATTNETTADPVNPEELISDISPDFGLLDYLETYEARMSEMTSTLGIMSEATVRVGELMTRRANEITELDLSTRDAASARAILKRSAADLQSYADILASHLPPFSISRTAALESLSNALALRSDFSQSESDDLPKLKNSLATLLEGIRRPRASLISFRDTTQSLPRLTADLNRAKRAASNQLSIMLSELDKTDSIVANILESIETMLTPPA